MHPDVTVEMGTERFATRALVLTGEERDQLYAKQASVDRRFAEFQVNTMRTIPVIALPCRGRRDHGSGSLLLKDGFI